MRLKLEMRSFLTVVCRISVVLVCGVFFAPVAYAAYPTVAGTASNTELFSTTPACSLPTPITVGNLLIVVINIIGADPTTPAGWTQLFSVTQGAQRSAGYYRVATGSEGSSLTITLSSEEVSICQSYRLTGVSTAPEAQAAGSGSGAPNPPSLSPSWGATLDTLWLAFAMVSASDVSSQVSGIPASYTNSFLTNNFENLGMGSGRRELTAASEDPGTFTTSGTVTDRIAATIGIPGTSSVVASRTMRLLGNVRLRGVRLLGL